MGDRDGARTGDGARVGIWELAPGIERSNFFSLLGAAFFSIGLLTLVGNLRPYLFNSMLAIPDDVQGRVSAGMDVVSEIPALLLSGIVGAASDKLDEFEARGWRLDMAAIRAAQASGDTIFAIPCPARREINTWVLDEAPRVAPQAAERQATLQAAG